MNALALDVAIELQEQGIAARLRVQRMNNLVFADPELDPADLEPVARTAIKTLREMGDGVGSPSPSGWSPYLCGDAAVPRRRMPSSNERSCTPINRGSVFPSGRS